eukprot:6306853-Amphidinium_carterae.2
MCAFRSPDPAKIISKVILPRRTKIKNGEPARKAAASSCESCQVFLACCMFVHCGQPADSLAALLTPAATWEAALASQSQTPRPPKP